jgi:hypothetical protein
MLRPLWSALSVAGVVLVAAPWTASATVTRRVTPAGTVLARAALLRHGDFGKGWNSAPGPSSVPPLTCPRFSPHVPAVTEVGDAASPVFRESSNGPFVAQDAYAYATAAQRTAVWGATVRRGLVRCVAESLVGGSGRDVRFAVTGKRLLGSPKLAVAAAGYRVSGTATSQGQSVNVFLDMLVLGSGRTITSISLSSFEAPVARPLELRLARAVARRMGPG